VKWKIGILTISDTGSAGKREDLSGPVLKRLVTEELKGEVHEYHIIPDEQKVIEEYLVQLADVSKCHLICTTGGTGFAARDVTPEATRSVIDKEAPGIPERMRAFSLQQTKFAILSRAVAGIRGSCLVINFPGSPKGVKECYDAIKEILPHALQLLQGNTEHE
jgi:molybdopterin adenylyltransferase